MDPKTIGARLRALRLEKDKTLEEVSSETGLTVSALGNYENGLRIPRDESKTVLASYYGKDVQSIFFD